MEWLRLDGLGGAGSVPDVVLGLLALVVTVRVVGRTLTVRTEPVDLRRLRLEGRDIGQLCIEVRARSVFARNRENYFKPCLGVVARLRTGKQVKVSGTLETATEAAWLASELTRALDLAEPPVLLPSA